MGQKDLRQSRSQRLKPQPGVLDPGAVKESHPSSHHGAGCVVVVVHYGGGHGVKLDGRCPNQAFRSSPGVIFPSSAETRSDLPTIGNPAHSCAQHR